MRSAILTSSAVISAGLALVAPTNAEAKPKKDTRPNVIFILMDDAGYGDFSCYGQKLIETPNIDALAASGIRFTDMYSAAPVSSPSRGCLLTGQHSGHAQIRENHEGDGSNDPRIWNFSEIAMDPTLEGQMPLKAGTPTLGTLMKEAGYATGMVGKWGVGGPTTESVPWKMGFDFYYGCICQRMAHNYYGPYMYRNDKKEWFDYNWKHITNPGTALDEGADPMDERSYDKYSKGKVYSPDRMFENVMGFVKKNASRPFFLMWTTPLPHSPLQAPKEWVDKYVQKFGDEEPLGGEFHLNGKPHNYYPCRYPHATYAAMISYFDDQVGKLVEELKRQGIYENTIIIFTSDNGPANNAAAPTKHFHSAGPFRCGNGWCKRYLKEGGIRMPFIASWPGHTPKGELNRHMGYFCDIMPTLCDAAGIKAPKNDGISLYPILSGKAEEQKEHEFLYWETPGRGGQVAVRWGNWKAYMGNILKGNRRLELYDITVPSEDVEAIENNVAAFHPEVVERMWKYIGASHEKCETEKWNMDLGR